MLWILVFDTGAVHKWRHTILGKNLPPPPLVTFRHKYLTPPSSITSQFANPPPLTFAIANFHLFCVCLDKNFHLFYRFDLCTMWQDQYSIRKTSKILHTRPAISLGHQGWQRVFWEGLKFFKLCLIVFSYAQHIFQKRAKNFTFSREGWLRACCTHC